MARHGLSRPSGRIEQGNPVPHDAWLPDLLTGRLVLSLKTPPGQFVSPGTGRLALVPRQSGEVVAQEAARAAGIPVIPGSGIKGAVRTVFELLSFSCDPFATACSKSSCCEACSVFGLLGWNGRVDFSDARPASADSVVVKVEQVPIPWLPHPEKTDGDFRLYDLKEAVELDPERRSWQPRAKDLTREVFTGQFETRLAFWNLSREELGRVILCMGFGGGAATRFFLRLGGVKYDGKGAVEVQPLELQLVAPRRRSWSGAQCEEEIATWIAAAQRSPWSQVFLPGLETLARALGSSAG
jgi:hypothetical protein